jgi:hypothetical protein
MTAGIEIAFDSPTLEPDPIWTRLDDTYNVTSWSIDRGRTDELQRTGTGTAQVTIADLDGAFDPTNISSPFYGTVDRPGGERGSSPGP